MAYNEDDLNPVKGRIGELIFANYMRYHEKIKCIDPDMQKKGIDWRIEGAPYPHDIDVKFSDKLDDFFAVTFRNSSNIRMPFHKNCEATWLVIVSFDWTSYLNDQDSEELHIARLCRDSLQQEYNQDVDFAFTKSLIDNYVVSIVAVKVQRVVSLCEGFEKKQSGESNTDEQGNIVATRVGTDIYAAAHIKWSAIPPSSKIVHYENKTLQEHISTKPFYLTYRWPFNPNKVIAISEYGKTLEEMDILSLEWIFDENKHAKSTFYKKYLVSKSEFDRILQDLIKRRRKA